MRPAANREQTNLDDRLLQGVRARLAVSHFKRAVLGDLHLGDRAQSKTLFEALEDLALERAPKALVGSPSFDPLRWLGFELSPRAWEGWFGPQARLPQPGKLHGLDLAASRLINWRRPSTGEAQPLPEGFYGSLVHAGLLQTMLAPTEATRPSIDLLRSRAASYHPRSAWHLHLDAMELRAFCDDFKGIPWAEIVAAAAGRVLEILHRLWRPMDGGIYGHLSSDTRLQWAAASGVERDQIRASFAKLKPDRFEASMVAGASPSGWVTGMAPDIPPVHVHRLLFSVGADADFVQADRRSAWAMDLASAGMAAHALAWTDRYRQLGRKVTAEQLILAAIDALLLTAAPESEAQHLVDIDRELRAAMGCLPADWSHAGVSALHRARDAYRTEMAELGIPLTEVQTITRRAQRRHALVYSGDHRPLTPLHGEGPTRTTSRWAELSAAAHRRQGVGDLKYFSDLPAGKSSPDGP
jgi:hypothetical protein